MYEKYANKPNLLRVARELAAMQDAHKIAPALLAVIGRSLSAGENFTEKEKAS